MSDFALKLFDSIHSNAALLVAEVDRLEDALERAKEDLTKSQQDTNAALLKIAELEARIAQLTSPPPSPLLWSDNFAQPPKAAPDAYAIDAPPGTITVVPGGLRTRLTFTDPLNRSGLAKCELGPRFGERLMRYGRIPFGEERWHAITLTIPETWKRSGSKVSIIDFHGSEDPEEKGIGRNASLSVMIGGDDIYGWRLWSEQSSQVANEHRTEIFRFPFVRGIPYRFIFRTIFDWHPAGTGETHIWLSTADAPPVALFEEHGPNAYNDAEGPYFKFGLYVPAWGPRPVTTPPVTAHEIVWSDLRIAKPLAGTAGPAGPPLM